VREISNPAREISIYYVHSREYNKNRNHRFLQWNRKKTRRKGAKAVRIETVRTGQTPDGFPDLPPGWNEIILCTAGEARLVVENGEHRIGAGMVAFIPTGVVHAVRSSEDWACTVVRFPDQRDSHEEPIRIHELLIFHDSDRVFERLMNLAADVQLEDAEGMQAISFALGGAIYHMLQHCRSIHRMGSNEAVEQIGRLIRERFYEPDLDLALEIEKTGYCMSHFRRIFKAAYGRPPQQQLLRVRIDYAKQLLIRTDESIRAISLQTGFRDPYYFSRMFRQLEGCSPTDYVQRVQEGGAL